MDYSVSMGTREVGKVQVLKEGLYCRVICHAELYGSVMYRLAVLTGNRRENIGILAPVDGGYGLDRKIPRSRLPSDDLEFLLLPAHDKADGRFQPISPQEPFQYLDQLKNAYLQIEKGRMGIVIPDEEDKR